MIHLFLILCGSRLIREKWWMLFALGIFCALIGSFLFLDAMDGSLVIPVIYYTVPLAFGGAWALLSFSSHVGIGRKLRLLKGITCLLVVGLIIFTPSYSGAVIGYLVGVFLCLDASWRGACAWVVRYNGWICGLFFAVLEFLFGVWSFVPWPAGWEAEVGIDAGTLLLVSAFTLCPLALRIRRLPHGLSILSVLNRGETALLIDKEDQECESLGTALVHIWTPTGDIAPVNRGVSRYVAAVDKAGVISTGHAALELPPDVYISHYPAVEIDRSGSEFTKVLRATPDNNVPGLFQPSYTKESDEWCPSTVRVPLPGLNERAIRRFWQRYSADTTYNLTSRNCASAVVKALDAGLDGLFAHKVRSPLFLLRFMLMPEFRVAGFMRCRAIAMAWTPGIALDYVQVLRRLVTVLGENAEEPGPKDIPLATA